MTRFGDVQGTVVVDGVEPRNPGTGPILVQGSEDGTDVEPGEEFHGYDPLSPQFYLGQGHPVGWGNEVGDSKGQRVYFPRDWTGRSPP